VLKISKREFEFPITDTFCILSTRIIPNSKFKYEILDNSLIIQDTWLIQIVYSIKNNSDSQKNLLVTEHKVTWNTKFPWLKETSSDIVVNYHKNPKIISSYFNTSKKDTPLLNITTETILAVEPSKPFPDQQICLPLENTTVKPIDSQNEWLNKLKEIEDKYSNLTNLVETLEKRITTLEKNRICVLQERSKLNGLILDSLRLVPITKAIIEMFPSGENEPLIKTISNGRGFYYFDNLTAGIYDVKIKHPRFASLLIKDYVVKEKEDKLQDFILHRN